MSILDGLYLNHPPEFWKELDNRFDKIDPETYLTRSALLAEVTYFRGLVNFYESRIQEMIDVKRLAEKIMVEEKRNQK